MCHGLLRHPFSVEHVTLMVRHVFNERVTFHNGDGEVAPGVTLHRVGGHSDGLQVVRVETARGPVVLASDASHYYGNMHRRSPFPIIYNVGDMFEGWDIAQRLAGHPDRVIPGHDPIVTEIYPRASDKMDAFACTCRRRVPSSNRRIMEVCQTFKTIGFIGLGVMGEPICRNLVQEERRAGARLRSRAGAAGAAVAPKAPALRASVADVVNKSDIVFLCLPSARHVRSVFEGDGVLKHIRSGQVVVDLGTSSVNQTRDFAGQLAGKGRCLGRCADRAHAAGGAGRHAQRHGRRDGGTVCRDRAPDPLLCHRRHPLRRGRRRAGDKNPQQHGAVRNRQCAVPRRSRWPRHNGVDPALLLDTLSKGSADSFALRNHGMKAIVPGEFSRARVLDRICR